MITDDPRCAFPCAAFLGALAVFGLVGCGPAGTVPPGTAAARPGAELFNANCTPCHQQDARGIPGVYPSLVGSPVVLGDPQALALWIVKGQRAAQMPPGRYATAMPKFGWMKAADAAALLTYLRANFGNSAPPVEPAAIAAALGE